MYNQNRAGAYPGAPGTHPQPQQQQQSQYQPQQAQSYGTQYQAQGQQAYYAHHPSAAVNASAVASHAAVTTSPTTATAHTDPQPHLNTAAQRRYDLYSAAAAGTAGLHPSTGMSQPQANSTSMPHRAADNLRHSSSRGNGQGQNTGVNVYVSGASSPTAYAPRYGASANKYAASGMMTSGGIPLKEQRGKRWYSSMFVIVAALLLLYLSAKLLADPESDSQDVQASAVQQAVTKAVDVESVGAGVGDLGLNDGGLHSADSSTNSHEDSSLESGSMHSHSSAVENIVPAAAPADVESHVAPAVEHAVPVDHADHAAAIPATVAGSDASSLSHAEAGTASTGGAAGSNGPRLTDIIASTCTERKPGYTVAVACRNQPDEFIKSLPSWLELEMIRGVVVVDWSSIIPLQILDIASAVPSSKIRKLKILRVENEQQWSYSRAYNLAIQFTCSEKVLRLNCDVFPQAGLMTEVLITRNANMYAADINSRLLAFDYADFVKVHGYDESHREDIISEMKLVEKMKAAGMTEVVVPDKELGRLTDGTVDSNSKFYTNRLERLVIADSPQILTSQGEIQAFNPANYQVNSVSLPQQGEMTPKKYLMAALSRPREVSTQQFESEEAHFKHLGILLHDNLHVPWDIMKFMDLKNREKLFHQLMVGSTGDLYKGTARFPHLLAVHLKRGLGSRLLGFASAKAFAKRFNRQLIVIWEPDNHLDVDLTDMIVTDDVVYTPGFRTKWMQVRGSAKWDSAWEYFSQFESYLSEDDWQAASTRPALNETFPVENTQTKGNIYWKTEGLISSANHITVQDIREELLAMRPVQAVVDGIAKRVSELPIQGNVAVHMRCLSSAHEIQYINNTLDIGVKIVQEQDEAKHHRCMNGGILEYLKFQVAANPNQKYIIYSDDHNMEKSMCERLGAPAVCPARGDRCGGRPDSRSKDCAVEAFVDLLSLKNAVSLVGSKHSKFSLAISILVGNPTQVFL